MQSVPSVSRKLPSVRKHWTDGEGADILNTEREVRAVEVDWKLEPGRKEPKILVLAGEDSPELQRLLKELKGLEPAPIAVWQGDRSRNLPQKEFLRFYTEGKGVAAQTGEGCYEVRLRLYELEERLDSMKFVRISNSEIVNLERITAVDLSMAGTIRMTLDGQYAAYVSRRYMKKIKETLQLGRRGNK